MRPTRHRGRFHCNPSMKPSNQSIVNSSYEKMEVWFANQPETNDAEEEEQERKRLQKNDEDKSESDLLELTGRLGTRMKCFQREVEGTDVRIAKTKHLSSVSPWSPKRKRSKKR